MKINTRVAALLLSSALTVTRLAAVEIIAHRGASADAPENSLSSMKLAWEQKADAIELDSWLSSDAKLIVFHDADTKRFEKTPRNISSLTLAEAPERSQHGEGYPALLRFRILHFRNIGWRYGNFPTLHDVHQSRRQFGPGKS